VLFRSLIEPTNKIKIGDIINTINETAESKINGYQFLYCYITDENDNQIKIENLNIDDKILAANLTRFNEFKIIANYKRVFALNVGLSNKSQDMGEFEVYKDGVITNDREFERGTNLTIKAIPYNYHELAGAKTFSGILEDELDENDYSTIKIKDMKQQRTINVNFKAIPFDIKVPEEIDEHITIEKTKHLVVGDNINMIIDVPYGKKIKHFNINSVELLKEPENLTRPAKPEINYETPFVNNKTSKDAGTKKELSVDGNIVTFHITNDWIDKQGLGFNPTVTFSMTNATLMAIFIPAIGGPLIIGAILTFVLVSRKKNAALRKELAAERLSKGKLNLSKIIKEAQNNSKK
jgi:hypothetical protein